MKNKYEFGYRYVRVPLFGHIFYPIITIGLRTVSFGIVEFEFIVDTGADLTTIPHYMADRLGIDLRKAKKSQSQGIGGYLLNTWVVEIPIYIQGDEYQIRTAVTSDDKTPFLLGRMDLLDIRFNWNFDSKNKKTIFERI